MRLSFVVAAYTALALSQSVQAIPIAGVRETPGIKRAIQSSAAASFYQPALGAREYVCDQLVRRQARKPRARAAKRKGGPANGKGRKKSNPRAQNKKKTTGNPQTQRIPSKKPTSRSPSRQGSIASTDSTISSLQFAPPSPNLPGTKISYQPPTTEPPAPRPSRWQRAKTWVRQRLRIRDLEEELSLVERDWLDRVGEW